MKSISEHRAAYSAAVDQMETLAQRMKEGKASPELEARYAHTVSEADRLEQKIADMEADVEARAQHKGVPLTKSVPLAQGGFGRISVDEPDMYGKHNRSFLDDMYRSQIMGDLTAGQRLLNHQEYEMEKRAMVSTAFGALIPPQYLLDMYAKAHRTGRVYCDQVNHQDLPETGMQLLLPLLTQGTAAAAQATENVDVATQDLIESDLTVNVRTIAGYVPVSRQSLERAAYNEQIIFEDLTARVWASLDSNCLSGLGSSGTILGVYHTSGIEMIALSTWSLPNLWGALADAQARVAVNVGALGFAADRIVMHPRRWAAIASSLDASDRPLLLPSGGSGEGFNVIADGSIAEYGRVGNLMGLPTYVDSNIPTNLGIGEDEDFILVYASGAVHLWEPPGEAPISLAFPQQAATALSVRLVSYTYAAYTAARYPGATALIGGPALETPTYGGRGT